MSRIGGGLVRRIVEATAGPETHEDLLAGVGLSTKADGLASTREMVGAEAYYGLLERAVDSSDHGLPFRYGTALRLGDLGALGLAFKTARDLGEALRRLERYILVLSDTLDYELREDPTGATLVMVRPHHRRGAQLANECALAAVLSALRQIGGPGIAPTEVSFQHPAPASIAEHSAYFGCPIRFEAPNNGLRFDASTLATRSRLADDALSAYLLAELDRIHAAEPETTLSGRVHRIVTDSLPNGLPTKSTVARRLGMSERTLHRRLTEEGGSFREITQRARREAAESLLADSRHALAEVAFLTGFGDQSAFQRAFKTWTGQTPLTFRSSSAART